METISISLEDLAALVRGDTIQCGPVRVMVAEADLDGLRAKVAMNDTMVALTDQADRDDGDG